MISEVRWAISAAVGIALILIGWRFYPLLVTTHVVICFLLIIVVLLQSGKAADLAGAFGGAGSQTAFGPRGAATFLSKATTWCAIMFMITSMTMVLRQSRQQGSLGSLFERSGARPTTPAQKPGTPGAIPIPLNATPGQPAPGRPAPLPQAPAQQAPPAQQKPPSSVPPKP